MTGVQVWARGDDFVRFMPHIDDPTTLYRIGLLDGPNEKREPYPIHELERDGWERLE